MSKLPEVSARNQAIQSIAYTWSTGRPIGFESKGDPTAAFAWFDQAATGSTYDNSIARLLSNLANRDFAIAASLLAKVKEQYLLDKAIANISATWARRNSQEYLTWL